MGSSSIVKPKGANKRLAKKILRFIPLYLMIIPGLTYIIINSYIPMFGIIIAFKKLDYRLGKWAIFKSPWVGLDNFEYLFKTKAAWTITRNTVLYNLAFIVIGTIVTIGVAILLNEIRNEKARKVYQTAILLPFMVSIIIVSYLVFGFLSQEAGFINNSILKPLGISKISWYARPEYWPCILILVNVWRGFGYGAVIYFATLVGIDKSYYEAAAIDGAGRFKQLVNITLPCLKPTITILTLFSISKIFNSDFGLFYQIPRNSGPLIDVTTTIDTYVYRGLVTNQNISMASAAGFYQAIVGFILVITINFIVKKFDNENSLF